MALSRYLKLFPWPENADQMLAFSCKRGSSALLPVELVSTLQKRRTVPSDTLALLEKLEFVSPDLSKEKEDVFSFRQELNRLSTSLSVAVILNMDCNFQCRYCYEGNQKEKVYMSDETADQLIAFIKKNTKAQIKKVTLDLYGGEPLLSRKRIISLAAALQPFLMDRGVKLQLTLVTNGSLLTPKAVNDLLPWNLSGCKVTIDGPAHNHNQFRPFKDGTPTYERIIHNVRQCCDLVKIGVGGNYTRKNFHLFPHLLDDLERQGLTPDKLASVKFDPVIQTTDKFKETQFCSGCASISEPWLAEASIFLRDEVLKRGYRMPKITPTPCMIDMENSFTVHYDGTIYKCLSLIGHTEYCVGDIWNGIQDYSRQYHLNHWQKEEKCGECTYLPLCFGGCRYMAFQRDGHMANVDCQKKYLDATLESFIKQDIRYQGQSS